MKFLIDQGLPRSTVEHLRELGRDAEHVGDLGLATATDSDILDEGKKRGAIVVTLDADFHALLAKSNAVSPSVIRIRVQGLRGDDVARLLVQTIHAVELDLMAGAAVTVTNRRIALRRLPLMSDRKTGSDTEGPIDG